MENARQLPRVCFSKLALGILLCSSHPFVCGKYHVLSRVILNKRQSPRFVFVTQTIQVAPPDHPAGTTWVWDDGSGVVLKAEGKANEEIEQRKAEQKEEVRPVS